MELRHSLNEGLEVLSSTAAGLTDFSFTEGREGNEVLYIFDCMLALVGELV